MNILENVWFVGISTGIISGVLVFFLTKWIMDKRGKVEYFKQVHNADQNVINALKPYIADNGLPEIEIFEALIASVARSFCIDRSDMFSIGTYCEELIREIISDVYVSNDKKQEYTNSLAEYKRNLEKSKEKVGDIVGMSSLSSNYGEKMTRLISGYSSVCAAVSTMLGAFIFIFNNENMEMRGFGYPFDKTLMIWIPIFLLMLLVFIILFVMILEVSLKKIKHKEKQTKIAIEEMMNNSFTKGTSDLINLYSRDEKSGRTREVSRETAKNETADIE